MPCESAYLEPHSYEIYRQKTAQNLLYVRKKLGLPITQSLRSCTRNIYCVDDFTVDLCSILKSLNEKEIEEIVYNAKNKDSRQLADWWENHQEQDKERELEKNQLIEDQKRMNELRNLLSPDDIALIKEMG